MDNNIKLSVSILTYNQPKELKRTLESVLPQMEKGVEIVISDNSDNSETENLIKSDFMKNSYIRYFRNDGDKTFDKNVLRAVERAQGEYIWLFGDEGMAPNAISHILKIVENNKYNFIFTNFCQDESPGKPAVVLNSDEIFDDGNLVLEKVANVLGFISSIIIKKECLSSIDKKEMNHFIDLAFIHFYLVMHALSLPGLFYVCSYPYVRIYPPSPEGPPYRDGFKVFAVHFFKIAKSFKNKFRKKSLKKMLAKNFGHIWRGILVAKIRGQNTPLRQLLSLKYYWNFKEFWIALPFLLMPRFIQVIFYKIYKKLTRGNNDFNSPLTRVPWF